MAKLKSTVGRLLDAGVPSHKLSLPPATDGMSLSVRVANQMVIGRKRGEANSVASDVSLAIERCLSDIFLDMLLKTLPEPIDANIDTYVLRGWRTFAGPEVSSVTKVDFHRMSVSDIRSIAREKSLQRRKSPFWDT
ncbi:MAG: hypothetical protein R3E50_14680 [Halioglobus sp.]